MQIVDCWFRPCAFPIDGCGVICVGVVVGCVFAFIITTVVRLVLRRVAGFVFVVAHQ